MNIENEKEGTVSGESEDVTVNTLYQQLAAQEDEVCMRIPGEMTGLFKTEEQHSSETQPETLFNPSLIQQQITARLWEYKENSASYLVHLLSVSTFVFLFCFSVLPLKNMVLQKLIIASQLPSRPTSRAAVGGQSPAPAPAPSQLLQ